MLGLARIASSARELFRENRGGYRQVAAPQLSEHQVCARDVAVVDLARNQTKLVVLGQRSDRDLKRDQIGMRDQPCANR